MKHILITDDDLFMANICRKKFEESGFRVTVATDGHAAVEELVLHPPDVVLLDLMLPEIDGLGVLRFLRSRERLRELPVIVVSNLSYFSGVVQAAWHAGATYFFNKGDCSPASLVEAALKATAAGTESPVLPPPAPEPVAVAMPRAVTGPPPLPARELAKRTPATVPAAVPAAVPAQGAGSSGAPGRPPSRKPHVLVADDDRVIHGVLTFFLTQAGFLVKTASNGQQALEMAQAEPPDVLVLDGRMPELNGFEVLNRWREIPSLAKVPVIMLTSEKDESEMKRALASGAVAYLTKPFSPDDLVKRATELTGRRA